MHGLRTRERWREIAVVGVLGLTTGLGHGFYHFGVSAFVKPLAEGLQLSRGAIASGIAAGRALSGVATFVAGRLADRFDARTLLNAGALLLAAGLLAASLAQSPWQLLLAWGVVASLGVALGFTIVLDRLVLTIVPRERHGAALGWRFSGIAVGTAAAAGLAGLLLAGIGWRGTCVTWAVLVLLSTWLVQRLAVPRRPTSPAPPATRPPASAWTQVLRTRAFWAIAAVYVLFSAVHSAIVVHMVPLLGDAGMAPAAAAGLLGTLVLLGVPGRLGAGTWCDRRQVQPVKVLLAAAVAAQIGALALFVFAPGLPTALGMVALYGLASGIPVPVLLLLQSRSIGRQHFGTVQGCLAVVQVPFVVVLPVLAGFLHDRDGTYRGAIAFCIGVLLLALACIVTIPTTVVDDAVPTP